jgi:hypothetical protein
MLCASANESPRTLATLHARSQVDLVLPPATAFTKPGMLQRLVLLWYFLELARTHNFACPRIIFYYLYRVYSIVFLSLDDSVGLHMKWVLASLVNVSVVLASTNLTIWAYLGYGRYTMTRKTYISSTQPNTTAADTGTDPGRKIIPGPHDSWRISARSSRYSYTYCLHWHQASPVYILVKIAVLIPILQYLAC